MVWASNFKPEALRSTAFGSITASYVAMGAVTANPWVQCVISNTTDADVFVSFDGSTDHILLGPTQILPLNCSANGYLRANAKVSKGTQFYTKTAGAPSKGSIIVMGFYIP